MVNHSFISTIVSNYYKETFALLISLGVDSPSRLLSSLEIEKGDPISQYALAYFGLNEPFTLRVDEKVIYDQLCEFAISLFIELPPRVKRELLVIRDDEIARVIHHNHWYDPNFNTELRELYDSIIEDELLSSESVDESDVFHRLSNHPNRSVLTKKLIAISRVRLLPLDLAYLIKNIVAFLQLENSNYVRKRITYLTIMHHY